MAHSKPSGARSLHRLMMPLQPPSHRSSRAAHNPHRHRHDDNPALGCGLTAEDEKEARHRRERRQGSSALSCLSLDPSPSVGPRLDRIGLRHWPEALFELRLADRKNADFLIQINADRDPLAMMASTRIGRAAMEIFLRGNKVETVSGRQRAAPGLSCQNPEVM